MTMSATTTPLPDIRAEITAGQGISLPQAARLLPSYRAGRPGSPCTIWRWITSGIRLPDGSTLWLEGARLAGRWLTSRAALTRFVARQTPDLAAGAPPAQRTPGRRERAAAAAELERVGI
jgi:hypothetical protein